MNDLKHKIQEEVKKKKRKEKIESGQIEET